MSPTLDREKTPFEKVPFADEAARRTIGFMTPNEFWEFEKNASERHELWEGQVVTMPGGTPNHSFIGANTLRALGNAIDLAGLPYRVCTGDMMVCVADNKRYYPDVIVANEPPRYDDKYALLNPLVIVEMLSASTETFDLNGKFAQYRTIDSLCHYLVVEQNKVGVTHHEKTNEIWTNKATCTNLSDTIVLNVGAAQIFVSLQKIYSRIHFENADGSEAATL